MTSGAEEELLPGQPTEVPILVSERQPTVPLSPRVRSRGAPLPSRTSVAVVTIALVAFIAGAQLGSTRIVEVPAPSSSAPASTMASVAPVSTIGFVLPPSPLPLSVYHVSQQQGQEIALAVRFYAAYNAGRSTDVMALLSPQPHLADCGYSTHAGVSVNGRAAIETYLRARFAEHDHWKVEFYQENPTVGREVVVLPLARSNDTLLRLGAPGGVKRSFPEDFYLALNPDLVHFDVIGWDTMPGSQATLCAP
ncbi:MAG: hypothetical protein ACP5VP_12105 [Candidatus Limnocylindrales bacterium]